MSLSLPGVCDFSVDDGKFSKIEITGIQKFFMKKHNVSV